MGITTTRSPRIKRTLSLNNVERGYHHVIVKKTVKTESGPRKLPSLYIISSDGNGGVQPEIFSPILEYFEDRSAMSYSWKKNAARAVGLLIDYGMAMSRVPDFHRWLSQGKLQRHLFRGFAKALAHGTASVDANGRLTDETGLHWKPLKNRQAGVLLLSLSSFFKWMREDDANSKWANANSTDEIAKHPAVALRLAAEMQIRRQNSLLGHLKGISRTPPHPYPFVVKRPPASEGTVPTFPARYVLPFLRDGFLNRQGQRNDEAELLAHLAFGLGIRESEGFDLFVTDVQFVNGIPWIFFHHPSEGMVTDEFNARITRREYLQRFGLLPRNEDQGRNHAGWKGMHGDFQGTAGFWIPIDPIRNMAAALLKRYIFVTRPAIMAARPRSADDHPFLLVTPKRIQGRSTGEIGDPYTIEAFEGAWERAVTRIGRRFDDPNMVRMDKAAGNTPHGARHFYGKFLFTSGVEGAVIQRCMHHRTLDAHRVYTQLTPAEINDLLQKASRRDPDHEPYCDLRNEFMSQFENVPLRD